MAEVHSIADRTDPSLLLEMVRSNVQNIRSVVVSVVYENDGKEYQGTYHSEETHAELAYHAVAIDHYLKGIINGDSHS